MTSTRRSLGLIVLTVALTVLLAACSSSETTTTTSGIDGESATTTTDIGDIGAAEMCRTLELLSHAGTPPGHAATAMAVTDTLDMTPAEMTAYSDLLVSAPRTDCPAQTRYADAVAYWLGF